jgi:hypothetical protein
MEPHGTTRVPTVTLLPAVSTGPQPHQRSVTLPQLFSSFASGVVCPTCQMRADSE